MPIDQEMIILYSALGVILILLIWLIRLELKLKKILIGKNSETIDGSIQHLKRGLESLNDFKKASEEYLAIVDKKIKRNIGGVGTVRFNPFKNSGGNQSFATAFLNENGDGVIVSSLYSREHVSIFSKPVKNFKPEYDLSKEEKEALSKARECLEK